MELILYVWLAFIVVGLGVAIWAVRRLVTVTRHGLSTGYSRDRKNGKSAATASSDTGLWMGAAMIGSSDSSATFSDAPSHGCDHHESGHSHESSSSSFEHSSGFDSTPSFDSGGGSFDGGGFSGGGGGDC